MTTLGHRPPRADSVEAEPPVAVDDVIPNAFSHRQILIIMSGLMLGMFLATLDQTIVSTALPTIVGEFHRQDLLSWVVTVYLLTSTVSTPLYGKASDLYGRKRVLQLSICIFLVGSALCGLAQNMTQLIGFRALQGIGAGGLMSLALAVIADIIPPRERGRYQGYFSVVFVSSSIIGPLLGGFLVDSASWRWVFYVNLPLGLVALVVINRVLHLPFTARQVKIDWAGATLLVAGVSAILVGTQTGGRDFGWTSPTLLGLFAAGALLIVAFVFRERVATEPILPLRLLRNDTFRGTSLIGFLTGGVMFGVIIFLPQYLQVVRGTSATASGLMMLPVLLGVLLTSIVSGRLISRFGRYKGFVVSGTIIATAGLLLLAQLGPHTSLVVLGSWMFITGGGMGLLMQTLVMATQSAVETRDLGIATSSVMFFRTMGGAVCASAFGALLTNRLSLGLTHHLPPAVAKEVGRSADKLVTSPDAVKALPATVRHAIGIAYSSALGDVFLTAVPLVAVCIGLALTLREVQLRNVSGLQRAAQEAAELEFVEPTLL
ncbi:MAG TPA: MDR family MFS transporter [Frankiaceae bacterium]|jgi:EmrB/QacA subfamily drug resistance transporter|nr:MDR family MFS transporter [Frankiaceae bacterium]